MKARCKSDEAFNRIIYDVGKRYGAPMGRSGNGIKPTDGTRIYDRYVPFVDGAYDRGGAYWGMPADLRVSFTADLSYILFYRTTIYPGNRSEAC